VLTLLTGKLTSPLRGTGRIDIAGRSNEQAGAPRARRPAVRSSRARAAELAAYTFAQNLRGAIDPTPMPPISVAYGGGAISAMPMAGIGTAAGASTAGAISPTSYLPIGPSEQANALFYQLYDHLSPRMIDWPAPEIRMPLGPAAALAPALPRDVAAFTWFLDLLRECWVGSSRYGPAGVKIRQAVLAILAALVVVLAVADGLARLDHNPVESLCGSAALVGITGSAAWALTRNGGGNG
jgi:hypothetical protein